MESFNIFAFAKLSHLIFGDVVPPKPFEKVLFEKLKKSDLFMRIDQERWKEVTTEASLLSNRMTSEEIAALKEGFWNHPFFQETNYLLRCFAALAEGMITENDFIKVSLFNSCKRQNSCHEEKCLVWDKERALVATAHKVEVNHGFRETHIPDNMVTGIQKIFMLQFYEQLPSVEQLFYPWTSLQELPSSPLETYSFRSSIGEISNIAKEILFQATKDYLNEREFNSFLQGVEKLAHQETQFFLLKRLQIQTFFSTRERRLYKIKVGADPLYKRLVDARATISTMGGLNETLWTCREGSYQVVVQPSLAQEVYKARGQTTVIQGWPAIGFWPKEPVENGERRVLFIPCTLFPSTTVQEPSQTFVKTKKTMSNYNASEFVHQLPCSPLSVMHHDYYHLSLESLNPHRALWIALAKLFEDDPLYRDRLHDREFRDYKNRNLSLPFQFWGSLCDSLHYAAKKKSEDGMRLTRRRIERFIDFALNELQGGIEKARIEEFMATFEEHFLAIENLTSGESRKKILREIELQWRKRKSGYFSPSLIEGG